jgi:hypothetical protein
LDRQAALSRSDLRGAVPPIVDDVLRSPGRPLPEDYRQVAEARFGFDFSRVRVHTDARAAESAREVNALAYTVGRHVVFGAGLYALESPSAQRLLAHELAHVVQQGGTWAGPAWSLGVSSPSDASERDADAAADHVLGSGITAPRPTPTGHSVLSRVDIPGWDCPRRIAGLALRQAQLSGLPGLHNGPADAYRHCWWSCEMVRQCSWTSAYVAGTGHELTDWTAVESDMDLNNNAQGRDCGGDASASCDHCCRDRLARGRLTVMATGQAGSGYYNQGNLGYQGIRDTVPPGVARRY